MSLTVVEMRRGLSRRSTRVLIAIALGLIVFMGVILFLSSRTTYDGPADLENARRDRDAAIADCVGSNGFGGEVTRGPGQDVHSACEAFLPLHEFLHDRRFKLVELWQVNQGDGDDDNVLTVTGLFIVMGALIGGASFIGGDWRFGTIGTQLTWEPRRRRVFAAKAAAVGLVSFVVCVLLQVLVAAAVLPSAIWRGTTDGTDGAWLVDLAGAIARIAGLGACAALLGFAIASIGRNTAAALGLAFGYVAVFEGLVRGLKPEWQRWLVGENSTVFLLGRLPNESSFDRTVLEAMLLLALYLGLVLFAAGAAFSRRDVTT